MKVGLEGLEVGAVVGEGEEFLGGCFDGFVGFVGHGFGEC